MLRGLPSIDRLLAHTLWADAPSIPHHARRDACRAAVDAARVELRAGTLPVAPSLDDLVASALLAAARADRPQLRRVINGTGVILHTNLGRAPLAAAALDAIAALAGGYLNLEMDLHTGVRDSRHTRLSASFARIVGCADVVVANNNAAAVFLALSALARGERVVVSRGELVEIGGSFRMPEIMEASGATLVEVGSTNRTHGADYRRALEAGARVVMKVHRSNFAQIGFTAEVSIEELGAMCREHGALLLHDLGQGALDHAPGVVGGVGPAESVRRSLDAGAHVVLFSGDKLLGGPQCGLLAGDAAVLARVARHPVMRLVRPGKLTLIALEATLQAWARDPSGGLVPAARLLVRTEDELRGAAEALAARLRALEAEWDVSVAPTRSAPGGGALPAMALPSYAVSVHDPHRSEEALAAALRDGDPAVVGRLEGGRLLLDLRTLLPGDEDGVVAAFIALR